MGLSMVRFLIIVETNKKNKRLQNELKMKYGNEIETK